MMPDSHFHRGVGRRFSAAAPTYAAAAGVQDAIARRVLAHIPAEVDVHDLLDAGCGPGELLALAGARWPGARRVGVDVAPGMVRLARQRFAGDPRTEIVEADLSVWSDPGRFDLVLSSSALHWVRPFEEALRQLARRCRPGGWLSLAIMLDGTLAELRAAREAVAPHKAAPGRLPTWEAFEAAAAGLAAGRACTCVCERLEACQPSGAQVLRLAHALGVTGGAVSRGAAPLTRGELRAVAERYDRRDAVPGGVRVSYRVGYLTLQW